MKFLLLWPLLPFLGVWLPESFLWLGMALGGAGLAGQAIELVKDRKTKEPDAQLANRLMEETKKRGVLIGKGGLYGNVIRTGMMLNSTTAHVDEMCDAIDAALSAAAV